MSPLPPPSCIPLSANYSQSLGFPSNFLIELPQVGSLIVRKTTKVPSQVQSPIQGAVQAETEIISASKPNRKDRRSSLGRYLARSTNSYIFQMRLPKRVLGQRQRLLRLSLGPIPFLEARRLADELAGIALRLLRAIENHMDDQEAKSNAAALLGGAGDEDDLLSIKFMTMLLKSAMYDIRNPPAPLTPEEAKGHEVIP